MQYLSLLFYQVKVANIAKNCTWPALLNYDLSIYLFIFCNVCFLLHLIKQKSIFYCLDKNILYFV